MRSDYEQGMLQRSELLLGTSVMQRIAEARVILFGVGGVGSWCAESLVRSGIRHLTIVDSDCVALSNCNRQLMATSRTVGEVKVDVLRQRLLEINPDADITALRMVYDATTAATFQLETYDFVIDAIDSLTEKAQLILHATSLPRSVTFFSSMGAALRIDPLKVRAVEFWKIEGDALARALRNKFKRQKTFPKRKFICVCSEERPMSNQGMLAAEQPSDSNNGLDAKESNQGMPDWNARKAQINGSLCHVTAVFGLSLSGLVLQTICKSKSSV